MTRVWWHHSGQQGGDFSLPTNTSYWQGTRTPSYFQLSFQVYGSSMEKVVKTHNNATGIAVLKAVLETNSLHQRGTQVELSHWKVALYTHVLLELFYTATHKMKATPFCCSTLVVFKNYTSEGTMCLSHPTPCTHTPSREHTASQYHGKGHWKHKVKREGEGSQSISALYMSFHKVKCSETCSDTLKVRPLANKRKKKGS